MPAFKLHSDFIPKGDQVGAIQALTEGVGARLPHQVLLGVTGSGKTFTLAHVIEQTRKPTLVIAHNKTLAAQLYQEFKSLFPENAVEYFVSYYDYYQPEAYLPNTDTYIEKDSAINDTIDRMRHSATQSLFERDDLIIVASVSCIYGLGSPEAYQGMLLYLTAGMEVGRDVVVKKLVEMLYERNDYDFGRGTFRVRGDLIEIHPTSSEHESIRVAFFGDTVEAIYKMDPLRGNLLGQIPKIAIYPGSHYVIAPGRREGALRGIEEEMETRIRHFHQENQLIEAQRIEQRTVFDLEMIREIGYCKGIENYSRHFSGRAPGDPPPTLLDYFPQDYLLIIDESHATVPQLEAMQSGDRSRKTNLIEHGFRLPSAYDNRPLTFEEFKKMARQVIYVSATPGPYEMEKAKGSVVEQIIRPTGLVDPEVVVRRAKGQVDDLLEEIRKRAARSERVLVTTLTKRMAEDLTDYYKEAGVRVRYLHSDIETLERVEIIRELRRGSFDVLIGINLLREGLDIPEVSLVAILDADKEGFLRSARSLIQTAGRAARHVSGQVTLYAEGITRSMETMMEETRRRRQIQQDYNRQHGITPTSIQKAIPESLYQGSKADPPPDPDEEEGAASFLGAFPEQLNKLEREMRAAAKRLEFERAATLRDRITKLKEADLGLTKP